MVENSAPYRRGSQTQVRGKPNSGAKHSRLPENRTVNRETNMIQLICELGSKLEELEEIGALVAAAHLQAAIDSLRDVREPDQNRSKPE